MFICNSSDIPDNQGRGFELDGNSVVVVRQGEVLFAYKNVCPHMGTPLNWMPDQFMDYDKRFVQCATHGALFEINTGLCVAGPCSGSHLNPVAIRVTEGKVFLV